MKSELRDKDDKVVMPCLMINKTGDKLVLGTQLSSSTSFCGVVLHNTGVGFNRGSYQTDWSLDAFDKYTGEVVLSN